MVKKNTKPSQKSIKAALMQAGYNPREVGPLAIITDQNDPGYFEVRAMELIREAREQFIISPNDHQLQIYNDLLIKATYLLTLARVIRCPQFCQNKKNEPKRK